MTKKRTGDEPTPLEQPAKTRSKKVGVPKVATPEKKELTAFDVLNMMNAARREKEQEKLMRHEQFLRDREARRQNLRDEIDGILNDDTDISESPLCQHILGDAARRFTYRNGRAFAQYESSYVPVQRKQALALARRLRETAAHDADAFWSGSLKQSLQTTLAKQKTADRIALPDAIETGIATITRAADTVSHLDALQRILEARHDWQQHRTLTPLETSKPISESDAIAQGGLDTSDFEDLPWGGYDDSPDEEYIQRQRQAFEKALLTVQTQLSGVDNRELKKSNEEQLDLFVQGADMAQYIEWQMSEANLRWQAGSDGLVLNDELYTLLSSAFDKEMYNEDEAGEASESTDKS